MLTAAITYGKDHDFRWSLTALRASQDGIAKTQIDSRAAIKSMKLEPKSLAYLIDIQQPRPFCGGTRTGGELKSITKS